MQKISEKMHKKLDRLFLGAKDWMAEGTLYFISFSTGTFYIVSSVLFEFFFLGGFELKVLCLPGRLSPALLALGSFQIRVLSLCPGRPVPQTSYVA
jgi:hypothetical protein